MMEFNKKGFAVLLALSLGMSGAALAASADSFSDVPKDHWSYEALDYLAKEGVIEGMGNSTFEGGRTMTRYEVASIVAKAMQKGGGNFGDKTVLEKLHAEYADEINVLQQQVAKNTKQIEQNTNDIQENKEKIDRVKLYGFMRTQYDHDKYSNNVQNNSDLYKDNDRFYMSLNGSYKVNDNWKAKFQSETNPLYNGGHDHENESGSWATDGKDKGRAKRWSGHDGDIQRIWVEGMDPKTGAWINIGRAWRGLGQQNVLFGTESDGFQLGVPIHGTSLDCQWLLVCFDRGRKPGKLVWPWCGGNIGPRAWIST